MAKLTREELRIIEQTKRQSQDRNEQKKESVWTQLRASLLFMLIFVLFVFCAYLIISKTYA